MKREQASVLLVHGMARTSASLLGLARYLRSAGYPPRLAGYVAAFESYATVCSRVRKELEELASGGTPYALVAHSLGGLILRSALASGSTLSPAPSQFIMLGTPNQPPRLARRVRKLWPYRLVTGQVGQMLGDPAFFASLPPVSVPYTIIAGTSGRRGRWSPFGQELNDGVVAVAETLVSPTDTPLLFPARHTFIMNHSAVRRAVRDTLDRAMGSHHAGS